MTIQLVWDKTSDLVTDHVTRSVAASVYVCVCVSQRDGEPVREHVCVYVHPCYKSYSASCALANRIRLSYVDIMADS